MSFCNVMMSCYVEVVKQVTVLVVTTCESVNSHLLLSPCTSLELATCTLQKSFPKIYHQFLSVSLAVQPLKRSTSQVYTPSPYCDFLSIDDWRRRKIGCHTNPQSKSGVKFLGIVPFWLYFCHFGTENSRFGTIPGNLLYWLHPKLAPNRLLLPQLKHRGQGL